MVGDGMGQPQVSASSLRANGTPIAHCVYDYDDYTHPHADLADDGQYILDYYDAVVLIPENPLLPGVTYAVTLTIDGQVYNWNFSVAHNVITNLAGIVR